MKTRRICVLSLMLSTAALLLAGCLGGNLGVDGGQGKDLPASVASSFVNDFFTGKPASITSYFTDSTVWKESVYDPHSDDFITDSRQLTKNDLQGAYLDWKNAVRGRDVRVNFLPSAYVYDTVAHIEGVVTLTVDGQTEIFPMLIELHQVSDKWYITTLEWWVDFAGRDEGENDSADGPQPDSTLISASFLTHSVVDAEYSHALGKLIMAAADPSELYIYDPITQSSVSLKLPLPPRSVSVGPDGLYAAVGHNGYVSYINLLAAELVRAFDVPLDVLDVVLADNGYVYAFPNTGQWTRFYGIDLATGNYIAHTGNSVRSGTRAKLHPSGDFIYGADNGTYPSDIEKYDIREDTPRYMHDSVYHGHYSMAGNLWISQDGRRIFTRSGNVFTASEVWDLDMLYNGLLESIVEHLDHSLSADKVATIDGDGNVRIHDYSDLKFDRLISLQALPIDATNYVGRGRFVFFSDDGTNLFVIFQAPTSGRLHYFGVAVFHTDAMPVDPTAFFGSSGNTVFVDYMREMVLPD